MWRWYCYYWCKCIYNTTAVDGGNYSITYLTLKASISKNDWCYFRQIGVDNNFKLALDFHDDGTEARFCIRSINATLNPDTITEAFTVGKLVMAMFHVQVQ